MSLLSERLTELESIWVDLGQPSSGILAAGSSPELVSTKLREIVSDPIEDAITWFAWHDGGSTAPFPNLAPSRFEFMPLSLCLSRRTMLIKMAIKLGTQTTLTPVHLWDPNWLPIGDDGGSGSLSLDLQTGAVRCIDWEDEDFHRTLATSLTKVVDLWIEALELNLWSWNSARSNWDCQEESVPINLQLTNLVQ